MEWVNQAVDMAGSGLLYGGLALICVIAVLISSLSFSGPWLVAAAAALAALVVDRPFPGWGTIVLFLLISLATEVFEFFASSWGVTRRGGSRLAGVAALIGGLAGLVVGSGLIPVVGSLIGMIVGSFGLAYLAEYYRLKHVRKAVDIAWGTVTARILVILIKMGASFFMGLYLLVRLAIR